LEANQLEMEGFVFHNWISFEELIVVVQQWNTYRLTASLSI